MDEETFGPTHLEELRKGLELFNSEHYWECHEELEHYWLEQGHDPVRYIYWALIQVATSLYHFRQSNQKGAWGQLAKAYDKILHIERNSIESTYLIKHLNWEEFKKLVKNIKESENIEWISKLQEFKFILTENENVFKK